MKDTRVQLLQHMVQAQLVAQLLCCIPLTSVAPVMSWLTSAMPQSEQEDLLLQVWPSTPPLPNSHFAKTCSVLPVSGACMGKHFRHQPTWHEKDVYITACSTTFPSLQVLINRHASSSITTSTPVLLD